MSAVAIEPSPLPDVGLHREISEHVYRAWDAVNQSTLWTFRRSPAHARYAFLHPDATDATDLGSAIHVVLLEPAELENRFAVRPPGIDRRTNVGKAQWAEFELASVGKTILESRDAYETLLGIRDALADHPLAFDLLTKPGLTEISALWRSDETACKGRIDRLTSYGGWTWAIDVKSTNDASRDAFARSCVNYGYYLQAAFYLDGLETIDPRDRRFAFIAVEKKPPYAMAVYEPDIVFLEAGRDEYARHMRTWRSCIASGRWPGYPAEIETLTAPFWFEKRLANVGEGD